jgi:ATP-dependent DNA helicase PIF1
VASQWRKCRHLIIDEISMVDGNFFKKLEAVARQAELFCVALIDF